MKIHLLAIDCQRDFCEPTGALFVPGAVEDMQRLAAFIRRCKSKLDDMHFTLDSHHYLHIAHPIFWKDSSGNHPAPFTIISPQDVESGKWMASVMSLQKYCLGYTKTLEQNGKYPLCIWPPHCLIGSSGYDVVPEVFNALLEWERDEFGVVDYVSKGSNVKTEHYSAIKADVPDPNDPGTQINTDLINVLMTADKIVIVGEALSHCVANTVRDTADAFGNDDYVKKMVLLKDCSSTIQGFEAQTDQFLKEMTARGMEITTSDKFLK